MLIFIQRNGHVSGPYSRELAVSHLQQGILGKEDLACTDEKKEWRLLHDLLDEEPQDPSTVPANQDQDTFSVCKIFVQRNGETFGPFSKEEAAGHLDSGVFCADDLACTEDNLEARFLKELIAEEMQEFSPVFRDIIEPANGCHEDVSPTPKPSSPEPPHAAPPAARVLRPPTYEELQTRIRHAPSAQLPRRVKNYMPLLAILCTICFLAGSTGTYLYFKPKTIGRLAPAAIVSSSQKIEASRTDTAKQTEPDLNNALPPEPAVQSETFQPVDPNIPSADSDTVTPDMPAEQATAANPAQPKPAVTATHQITLPEKPGYPNGTLWVADTALQPKAILLLCLSPNGSTQSAVQNASWQSFAKNHGLALAAFASSSREDMLANDANNSHAGSAVEDLVIAGLRSHFGDKLPLIPYGYDVGGILSANLANWRPTIVKAWGAYTNHWPEILQAGKNAPPGMLVCDREDIDHQKTNIRTFFLEGRSQGNPWALIPLAMATQNRKASVESFFRDYVGACLSSDAADANGVWINIERRTEFSKLDMMTRPKEAEWLPDASLIDQMNSLISDRELGEKPIILQKEMATQNPKQPHLKLYLRLPPGAKSGKDVSSVLAYCTWDNNESSILAILGIQENQKLAGSHVTIAGTLAKLIKFADNHNMAVLTWGTVKTWNTTANSEDLTAKEEHEQDINFDTLANAWERGIDEFSKEIGLPKSGYLLYGMSRGAQWAHRLALRKPQYFLAINIHIPSTFDIPTPEANRALWLLTTGEHEYGYESAKNFYKECSALGYPMIFKAIPNLGHDGSPVADNLTFKFFEYALSVRDIYDTHETQLRNTIIKPGKSIAGPWLEAFRQPQFFGDILNQDCFPVAQAAMIDPSLRVPLPTKALADAWNK